MSNFRIYVGTYEKYNNGSIAGAWVDFENMTKAEFYEEGIRRRILTAPMSTAKDLWENPQLKAREYWVTLEHPELEDMLSYCGAFVKMSESPITCRRRAPLIGEHNEEVYRELGLSADEISMLKQTMVI